MANTMTRYNARPDMVPTRSVIDQLLDGSFLSPTVFDRWFTQPTVNWPANLIETDDSYVVQIGLPGLDHEKLEIQASHRDLRIKGSYLGFQPEKGNYIWQGLPSGEFVQTFTLPNEVASDGAEASYTNGILSITMPKSDRAKVKTIPVKTTV